MGTKEVVWIFGNSAAGKETFVRYATSQETDVVLLERLGWVGKKVVACAASIEHIGQFRGDPTAELRENILFEVPKTINDADVVVINWQGVDSGARRPQRLLRTLPDATHRVIQILTPNEELYERLVHKSWWDMDDPRAFVTEEHVRIASCIKQLGDSFSITRLSGQAGARYADID